MDIKFYYINDEALEYADRVPYTLYYTHESKILKYDDSRGIRRTIEKIYCYPTEATRLKSKDFEVNTIYLVVESNKLYLYDYFEDWIQLGPDHFYYFEIPHIIVNGTSEIENIQTVTIKNIKFRKDSTAEFVVDPSLFDLVEKSECECRTGECRIRVYCKPNEHEAYPEIYGRLLVNNYSGTNASSDLIYTNDHNELSGREDEDSHPIEAISGLDEIDKQYILDLWGKTDLINDLIEAIKNDPSNFEQWITEHNKLSGRDEIDSHPIEAISGLEEFNKADVEKFWRRA